MTIGVYCIMHVPSGKRYIGKSVNVEARLAQHKYNLTQLIFDQKKCNRHLWNAVQKYGWDQFETWIVEAFDKIDEDLIAERELHWMDELRTCERPFGYNLRRDSRTKMIVHEETRALISAQVSGPLNPNYGNHWTDEQRAAMSANRRSRAHRYGDDWRRTLGERSREFWQGNPEKRAEMGAKVAEIKRVYDFLQYDRDGRLVRRWSSMDEIVAAHPDFKRQVIYSVCHGWKKTYKGFVWRQERKAELPTAMQLLLLAAA